MVDQKKHNLTLSLSRFWCGRLILDTTINDSSVELFDKLDWLPKCDIVRIRKLFMLP